MRILQVSDSDESGGAARAARRLHEALIRDGVTSSIGVQRKYSDREDVHGPYTFLQKLQAKAGPWMQAAELRGYPARRGEGFSSARVPYPHFRQVVESLTPNVVHLHGIDRGFLRLEQLGGIKQPIVWTLHDMWPFTGGCHYSLECDRFGTRCGSCPYLGSTRSRDLSSRTLSRKDKAWRKLNLTLVAPSRWMAEQAAASALLGERETVVVPNALDTQVFKPLDSGFARRALNLPTEPMLILFGAVAATTDPRKGFDLLLDAMRRLPKGTTSRRIELVVFGASSTEHAKRVAIPMRFFGHVRDDVTLAMLYSACDVTVAPSVQESFGLTAAESLACGTPVVAFGGTGLDDVVDHRTNGYLAANGDPVDLARGLEELSRTVGTRRYSQFSRLGRAKAVSTFDREPVARAHRELYQRLAVE